MLNRSSTRRARVSGVRLLAVTGVVALAGLLAACGSSSKPSTAPPPNNGSGGAVSGNAAVTIKGFAFKPSTLTIKAGTTVTWTNEDGTPHNIQFMSSAIPKGPDLSASGGQKSWSHAFAQAGTYPYICGIHNYMTGTVKVVP